MRKPFAKRLASLFVSLAMVLTFIPMTVLAEEDDSLILANGGYGTSEYEVKGSNKMLEEDFSIEDFKAARGSLSASELYLDSEELQAIKDLTQVWDEPIGLVGFEDVDLGSNETIRVMVQLDDLSAITMPVYGELTGFYVSEEKAEELVLETHSAFEKTLDSSNISYDVFYEFIYAMNGYALEIPANKVEALAALPFVYAVEADREVVATSTSVSTVVVDDIDLGGMGMAEAHELFDTETIYSELGITGAGITVGVIDSGIDYNHPDLENAYIGGYDFVDNDDDPMETTYQDYLDADGWVNGKQLSAEDFMTSHGTHVSGTVVARGENDSVFKTVGLAPEADLRVYRVLGPGGTGSNIGVNAGIERSYEDGCDVINLSLGSSTGSNNVYDSQSSLLNNLVLAGVVVVASAGNNGEDGFASVTDPGTSYLAITVGNGLAGGKAIEDYPDATLSSDGADSTENVEVQAIGYDYTHEFVDREVLDSDLVLTDSGYEFVAVPGYGTAADFALLGIEKGDLEGKIAVTKRGGGVAFTDKYDNAVEYGAAGLIIPNNEEEHLTSTTLHGYHRGSIPVFSLTYSDGEKLYAYADAAGGAATYIDLGAIHIEDKPNEIAAGSSKGPIMPTYGLGPDIVAPGTDILSTYPASVVNEDFNNEDYYYAYNRASGTSMSAPHIAGIAALMKQMYPEATPAEIKARLMNTAYDMDGGASVFEIGAGFVDPIAALTTDIYVYAVQDVPHSVGTTRTVLEDQEMGGISFGVVDPGESYTVPLVITKGNGQASNVVTDAYFNDDVPYSNSASANGLTWSLSNSGGIWIGNKVGMDFTLTVPEDAATGTYEGYITFTVDGQILSMPFCIFVGEASFISITGSGITRPLVTASEEHAYGEDSEYTNILLGWEGYLEDIETYVYPITGGLPVGVSGWDYGWGDEPGDGVNYVFLDLVGSWVIPYDEATGDFGDDWVPLEDGAYFIINYAFDSTGNYDRMQGGAFIVDSSAPEFVVDQADTIIEYPADAETITITGNIYSNGVEQVLDYGLTYDYYLANPLFGQEKNAVVYNGIAYPCDEDGNFTLEIPVTEASRTEVDEVQIWAVDYAEYDLKPYWRPIIMSGVRTLLGNNRTDRVTIQFTQASEPAVPVELTADNGSATLVLDKVPDKVPTEADLVVWLGEAANEIAISDFVYDGECTITFTFEPVAATDEVQVITLGVIYNDVEITTTFEVDAASDVLVEQIIVNGSPNISLSRKKTVQIDAYAIPEEAVNATLVYTSSDDAIATVSETGLVTGVKGGTAMITIATEDGTVSTFVVVRVS